jgi:hypothetical protein
VRAERQALLARLADPAATPATTAAATALFGELPLPMPAFAAAVRRGWLQPTAAELQQRVADRPQWRDAMLPLLPFVGHDDAAAAAPWIEQTAPAAPGLPAWAALSRSLFFRQLRGQAPIPGTAALREVRALAGAGASSDQLAELLAFAEQQGADGENSDARLLKAAVLMAQDRAGEAARFLASTQGAHTADLRGRFLLVCAALTAGDPTLAREVLGRVGVDNLEHLRAAVGVPLSDAVVRRVAEFL